MRHRQGWERPLFSALAPAKSIYRLCIALATLEREWRSIVGNALADRSTPRMFEKGVLVVTVAGQSALQDINFKKNAIRSAILNTASLKIKDIKAEIGRVDAKPLRSFKSGPCARSASRHLSGADETRLGGMCAEIMSRHPHLEQELAEKIARCRIMRGE